MSHDFTSFPGACFFDDFNYASTTELSAGGWFLRSQAGWPGVDGAVWSPDAIRTRKENDGVVRLSCFTDGTSSGTVQSQLCRDRAFFSGTYAARVRFGAQPVLGQVSDQVIMSFYAISPYIAPMHPDYSELDFECLPNGGWGSTGPSLGMTSWETVSVEPWLPKNEHTMLDFACGRWVTLVFCVMDGTIRYSVDGVPCAVHGGKNYPRVPMGINFNLWFTREGLGAPGPKREWHEEIDWVFHAKDTDLSSTEVESFVKRWRDSGVGRFNNMAAADPALGGPCFF